MGLKSIFKVAAAVTLTGAAATGGYVAGDAAHHRVAAVAMPAMTAKERATAAAYSTRFEALKANQQQLEQTTDEEDAASSLIEEKKSFTTDAILDRHLSERDLRVLATRFNQLASEDGIRFRAFNFNAATMARRDECLAITPARNATFGADRYAYAQRVETCMIEATQHRTEQDSLAASMGGMAAGGSVGGLLLGLGIGFRRGRKSAAKAAKPA